MPGVPLPEGVPQREPYIVVDFAERLIAFLVEVFGGRNRGAACALMAASIMATCASVTRW
jgi:hypothetical protein